MIEYKYNEDNAIEEIKSYVNSTYTQHYSGKYQATDMIIDAGHGTGFCIGNIMKYAKRYGKKNGYNKKDLLKIIHYAIIQLHVHDQEKNGIQQCIDSTTSLDDEKIDSGKQTIDCYRRNPINPVSKKCHACDCWKSK